MNMRTIAFAILVTLIAQPALAVTYADRVQETSTTTGTGNMTLLGAVTRARTFNAAVGVGPTFPYAIIHQSANEWEMGLAVLSNSTTLVRTPESSSNANALVNFTAGTKNVFLSPTASLFQGFCMVDGSTIITGNFAFEGSTPDASQTTFAITNPTADRTITFKNESGTVAFLSDITNMSDAEIFAAVLTLDTDDSTLNADTLDGLEGSAYAVVAGGNTFASSNNYVANDITDADVVDTITASNYCALGGCTMSGTLAGTTITATNATVSSALNIQGILRNDTSASLEVDETGIRCTGGCELRSQSNGDVGLFPSGSGDPYITSGTDNLIRLRKNNGTEVGTIDTGTFDFMIGYTNFGSNDGTIRWNDVATANWGIQVGNMSAVGPTLMLMLVSEAVTTSPVNYFAVWGDGAHGVPSGGQQAITISTGDGVTSPVSSQVELTCTTAPCTYKPGETNAQDGWQIVVCNVDAADNIDIASAAGTVVVRGTPITMTPGECVDCTYSGAIWGCR